MLCRKIRKCGHILFSEALINNFHKKTEQILTHVVLYCLHFFKKLKVASVWGFTVLPKGTFTVAGHCNTNFTRVWWATCCSPVKKSARPLTSSCAPSVTSTAPTWDCQTAASTPRYSPQQGDKMFAAAVVHFVIVLLEIVLWANKVYQYATFTQND